MTGWLLDAIPTWLWILLAIVALVAAWRVLGLRGMLAVLGAIVTLGAYRAGRKAGGADAAARQQRINDKAVKDYDRIKGETDRMSDADLDAANHPWVRRPGKR